MHSKNPGMSEVVKIQKKHYMGWYSLPTACLNMARCTSSHFWLRCRTPGRLFEFEFLETDIECIGQDSDGAVAGVELLMEMRETMGDLWPDKGLIEHERYDECKSALNEMKTRAVEQLAETDEEKVEYERHGPFD